MALSIPYGFKFSPEDHELIYILYRKVNGNSLPVDEGLIEERDLFGKEEPWEIFGRGTEKTRYFFVKLKKKGKSVDGLNFVRTVGKGTWKGQDGQIPIKDQQGRTIGFKKNLVYKGKGPNTNGRWLMKEYHLHGVSLQPPPKLNDYVLCRIRKKDDGKKQNVPFDMEAHSRCQGIGGNQDGEGVSSMSCAENSILGRKRPRIEYMMDYELPNLRPCLITRMGGGIGLIVHASINRCASTFKRCAKWGQTNRPAERNAGSCTLTRIVQAVCYKVGNWHASSFKPGRQKSCCKKHNMLFILSCA
ncbi:hypothetical protein Acr_22g0008230 [Actinidia rufa]|uniref:NAC domain-containing protein n=1 Tax=Actinidia rufa TaxID=165716 RepID=A0A7J0GKW8_9ERIC|nr:hypothetical protein Acr_22g0008230 [Actinidia rufa]